MRRGEGRYIANWFAQRWQIEAQLQADEDKMPALHLTPEEAKGMQGGPSYPLGYFQDDPETEYKRLRGEIG